MCVQVYYVNNVNSYSTNIYATDSFGSKINVIKLLYVNEN